MEPNKHHGEKGWLIAMALLFGLIAGVGACEALSLPLGLLVGGGASFAYVLCAATAANAVLELRSWAYRGNTERPTDDVILIIGAFWPVTLLGGGLIYTFIGIINRTF